MHKEASGLKLRRAAALKQETTEFQDVWQKKKTFLSASISKAFIV